MHTGSYSVSAALLNQTRKSTVAFFATDPLRWVSARRTLIGGGFSGAAGERAAADRVRSGCPRGGQFFGDPVSPVECPRGGQGKWLVLPNPRGGRGAADMVWHASCPRGGQVFWVGASPGECPCGGQGKWLVLLNPPGRRGAEDRLWQAECPRGGIGERWMAAFF